MTYSSCNIWAIPLSVDKLLNPTWNWRGRRKIKESKVIDGFNRYEKSSWWRKFPLWILMSPSSENVVEPDSSKWRISPLELPCGKSGDKSWYCQLLNVSSTRCHSAAVVLCSKWAVTSVQFPINVNSPSVGSSPTFLVRLSALVICSFQRLSAAGSH